MVFRAPKAAPVSRVPEDRRGHVLGRFCHGCNQSYPLMRTVHAGDPVSGRDHVGSTCPYEGWAFEPDASWWELAVEVLPPPPPPSAEAAAVGVPGGSATAAPPPAASAPPPGQPAADPPKG